MALLASGPAFMTPTPSSAKAEMMVPQPLAAAGVASLLAAAPLPAYAGGMFDFGLTLPFVAVTFLTMMAVLNALFYAPVGEEMEERNKKLLQTLSEATDMLSKADEIQVEYTEQIRAAREKASKAVKAYRTKTEQAIEKEVAAAQFQRDAKATEVRARLA